MPKPTTLFVGLDRHKEFISVAHAGAHGHHCTRSITVPGGPWRKVCLFTTAPLLAVRRLCYAVIVHTTLDPLRTDTATLVPRHRVSSKKRSGQTVVALKPSLQTIVPLPVADSLISPTRP
jgi:hypothetical protein